MLLSQMPLRRADYWIVAVASMEQLIGGALSTVIGVMLPMLQLTLHPGLTSGVQGIVGAMGLIGIGIGSMVIGTISDRQGYLLTFRMCPVLVIAGALICLLFHNVACLVAGLLVIGIGVGGGYSLDSSYISELLPDKWRLFMVGVAKATCSVGFVGAAVVCVLIIGHDISPAIWPRMMYIILGLGIITLLMRVRWWESPKWLLAKGEYAAADKCTKEFLGNDITLDPPAKQHDEAAPSGFKIAKNMAKIIFSGIPWACEGMAVYGFSVFLPVLVMALGIEHTVSTGVHKIVGSVEVTAVVNFFMLPGFFIGLLMLRKHNNVKMMSAGFLFAGIGLLLLLASYLWKWHVVWMLAGFVIFEVALNAGPHLLTFIIPSKVYDVAERGEGSGIAAFIGKVGAVSGVIFMPILLELGGMTLVLIVSAAVMALGAIVSAVYGKKLGLL